jgi:hypothetical protein
VPVTRGIAIGAIVAAMWLAGIPVLASAQDNCQTMPAGPARTDCYIGLSRIHGAQSDVAAGKARVQSDAARYRQVTGTGIRPKASRHQKKSGASGVIQ